MFPGGNIGLRPGQSAWGFINWASARGTGWRFWLKIVWNGFLDMARQQAHAHGIEGREPQVLISDREFLEIVGEHIQAKNKKLVRIETSRHHRIFPRDFSQKKSELTPSLKLRRKV
ncbi:MAG: hypothetical protein QNJ02_16820, partial [Desulfobacterales bacterium]|nr:hypothetical protein [Desulfobacterales bacterium]